MRLEQTILDFYTFPPIGGDDWRYTFETAEVRVFEMQMLTRATLLDMVNAENFESAIGGLAASEYALPRGSKSFEDIESILRARRTVIRKLFEDLMLDKPIVELFKTRDDFANIRLVLRRVLTEKPLGTDYSSEGNVSPESFEEVFEQENHGLLPDYMQQAVERAVLEYYQDKDIRRIDYAVDAVQAEYNLKQARRLESIFLLGLFRIQIDLTNIRTMLRLKFTESEQEPRLAGTKRNVFLQGGYLQLERLKNALDTDYEAMGSLFFVTPYYEIVQAGANYLASDKSFLRVERRCENYLIEFLKTTIQITAGPQPSIAFLLMKENEIRNVRLILTAKKNLLAPKLILDRIS